MHGRSHFHLGACGLVHRLPRGIIGLESMERLAASHRVTILSPADLCRRLRIQPQPQQPELPVRRAAARGRQRLGGRHHPGRRARYHLEVAGDALGRSIVECRTGTCRGAGRGRPTPLDRCRVGEQPVGSRLLPLAHEPGARTVADALGRHPPDGQPRPGDGLVVNGVGSVGIGQRHGLGGGLQLRTGLAQ